MKITTLLKTTAAILFLAMNAPIFADNSSNGAAAYVKDTAITALVKTKIAMDKNVSDANVSVTTNNAIVTLDGTVNSGTQATILTNLAASTEGVKNVDTTKLKVKASSQYLTDLAITTRIKTAFLKDRIFGEKNAPIMQVSVETNNGVVYLSGTVNSSKEAQSAVDIAKGITGVTHVQSSIVVNNPVQ